MIPNLQQTPTTTNSTQAKSSSIIRLTSPNQVLTNKSIDGQQQSVVDINGLSTKL